MGMSSQPPDRGASKTSISTPHLSPVPETANPAIPPEPPIVEDDSLAEDSSEAEDDFLVSITYAYSTIIARARSFRGMVLTGVTPLLLAQNGFYYQASGVNDLACCFACQSTKHLSTFQRTPFEEVQQLHEEDCIWQIISCDLKYHLGTTKKPPSSTTAISSPERSSPTADSSTQTNNDLGPKSRIQSTPITSSTAKKQMKTNLDGRSNPLPATLDPEPQQPRPTCSPQPLQPTWFIISSPHNQQPTYASILQHPTSSPQSTPKPDKPVPLTIPTLTI